MKEIKSIMSLSAAHMVTDFYSPVLPAIIPLLVMENGYPFFLAGLIFTVFNLTSSFTQPVIGWLYDRKGLSVPIFFTVLISGFFLSFIGIVHNYWLMILFAALGALGHALFHPVALGMVSRLAAGSSRGRLTSYFVVGGNLGFALGPIVVGILVDRLGLSGLVFLVLPAVVISLILYLVLPRDFAGSARTAAVSREKPKNRPGSVYAVSLVVGGSAFRAWAIFSSMAFVPAYLVAEGFDLVIANLLLSSMLIAGVIGQVIGGIISDRYGRKEYTLAGTVASIPFFYIFITSSGAVAVAALIIFGFTIWSTFSVTVAMAHELMPGDVGTVSGLMLGLAVGTGGLGVALTGYLADAYSLDFALILLLLPIVLALATFFAVPYPWRKRDDRQSY